MTLGISCFRFHNYQLFKLMTGYVITIGFNWVNSLQA